METSYVIYDLIKKKIIKVYSALAEERYTYYTLYYSDGTLVDLYNQKEYKVKAANFDFCDVINVDIHGYRKYVAYRSCQDDLILIHISTGRQDVILRFTDPHCPVLRILDNLNQLMYLDVGIRIYDITTRTYVYVLKISNVYDDYRAKGIDGIHFHKDSKFIGYNKKKEQLGRNGKVAFFSTFCYVQQ
ncbi:unnamed protein product [Bursaphelenchus okinawaensis]|uniref:Uncharacterized protein n=1 Tax=Bursaphelenchus okinawaensis TaxID=465554 RepID=A0A811KBE9_9BILA|nr:unnamed protein product [Bursaphelenchus okinawaensis]CAG9097324.1 unnamed protein product [Bursaphelenchus okinawaensis]